MRGSKISAIAADRDRWMRQAFEACIAAARDMVADAGPIRPGTPIGRLTEGEWGWIISSVVWAWIATRAEQAATEGWNDERAIRTTDLTPDPWDAGAVISVLPKLAEAFSDFDWSRPVGDWPRDVIAEFLTGAFHAITRALAARDIAEAKIAGATNPDVTARQMNAAAGNPRMTAAELDDDCPF
jgi:hypothetical protein